MLKLSRKIFFSCLIAFLCTYCLSYFNSAFGKIDCMNKIYRHRDYFNKYFFSGNPKKAPCENCKLEFKDTCGAGCECNYDVQSNIIYHSIDPGKCKYNEELNFACDPGWTRFDNACGCGCIPDENQIALEKEKVLSNRCGIKGKFRTYYSNEVAKCPSKPLTCPGDATPFLDECGCGCESIEGPAFTLYSLLPNTYDDCGIERKDVLNQNYNSKMRTCFYSAYEKCRRAKIYQKKLSPEGKPIAQTAYTTGNSIEGKCEIKIFSDYRDSIKSNEKYVDSCYSANIKTLFKNGTKNENKDFLNIGQCRGPSDPVFYF